MYGVSVAHMGSPTRAGRNILSYHVGPPGFFSLSVTTSL